MLFDKEQKYFNYFSLEYKGKRAKSETKLACRTRSKGYSGGYMMQFE